MWQVTKKIARKGEFPMPYKYMLPLNIRNLLIQIKVLEKSLTHACYTAHAKQKAKLLAAMHHSDT